METVTSNKGGEKLCHNEYMYVKQVFLNRDVLRYFALSREIFCPGDILTGRSYVREIFCPFASNLQATLSSWLPLNHWVPQTLLLSTFCPVWDIKYQALLAWQTKQPENLSVAILKFNATLDFCTTVLFCPLTQTCN